MGGASALFACSFGSRLQWVNVVDGGIGCPWRLPFHGVAFVFLLGPLGCLRDAKCNCLMSRCGVKLGSRSFLLCAQVELVCHNVCWASEILDLAGPVVGIPHLGLSLLLALFVGITAVMRYCSMWWFVIAVSKLAGGSRQFGSTCDWLVCVGSLRRALMSSDLVVLVLDGCFGVGFVVAIWKD
ncbi:hypothetical protein Nepgr_006750 [Nepenthes gracilis]|uniref:Transmembrane protein n=1 Tax=Nepenthes gracilis TaxID=150966 RepID=A0AAD3S606_NEPGR|nr:hypothetical protein Nepgr_006750 [Nepenthes gracilis]